MSLLEFDPPERFALGTVGPPGQRTFFLQANDGSRRVQVSLEKLHAQILAERIGELLDQVGGAAATVAAAVKAADNAPLDTPIYEDFRVSALALSWDDERQVVVIEQRQVARVRVRRGVVGDGFGKLGLAARAGAVTTPDLVPLAADVDRLGAALGAAEAERARLSRQVVGRGDQERKAIARDLHDEYGPCLFALRVEAQAIRDRSPDPAAAPTGLRGTRGRGLGGGRHPRPAGRAQGLRLRGLRPHRPDRRCHDSGHGSR